MTKRTKLTTSLALLAVIATATIYWAASSGASSGITTPQNSNNPAAQAAAAQQSPAAVIPTTEADQSAQFSVLSSSGPTFPATLATMVNRGAMKAQYGLNVALAHPVGANSGAWLIPGNGQLCLWITNAGGRSGGTTCATTAAAAAGELAISRMSQAGVQHVVGVVPDGTTSVSIEGQSLPIEHNGWEAVTGSQPTTATITTASGTKTVEVP